MAHAAYSAQKLFEIGRANYEKLVSYCNALEEGGVWSQVRQVMKQSSTQVLDLYVQSVLISLAVHCGQIVESQREYMLAVTDTNPLGIPARGEIGKEIIQYGQKTEKMPPIMIQICGVYDRQGGEHMAVDFMDAMFNILLCMAYVGDGSRDRVGSFLQDYYERISMFVQVPGQSMPDSRYVSRKMDSDTIGCGVHWLLQREQPETGVPAGKQKGGAQKEAHRKNTAKKKKRVTAGEGSAGKKETSNRKEEKKHREEEQKRQEEERKHREEEKKRLAEEGKRREAEEKARQEQEERQAREEFQKVKKRLKAREKAEQEAQEKRIADLLKELNELVGLESVKEEIRSLINLIKVRKMREKMNLPSMDMSYHMVFTGSPGTGKTTVARLVARIYKELGILSEGQLVETDRSRLVAGYVGQTAINVREIVEQAIGGVLFIDEAYALVSPDTANDFGSEAVDTLVKLMEDNRDNLVVIVAGYTEEMKVFLKSNTGLISRFNKFIAFDDYSQGQLLDILEVMVCRAGLSIEKNAVARIGEKLARMDEEEKQDFGNARGVRNIFEKMVMNQANRLVLLEEPTREQLVTLTAEDAALV